MSKCPCESLQLRPSPARPTRTRPPQTHPTPTVTPRPSAPIHGQHTDAARTRFDITRKVHVTSSSTVGERTPGCAPTAHRVMPHPPPPPPPINHTAPSSTQAPSEQKRRRGCSGDAHMQVQSAKSLPDPLRPRCCFYATSIPPRCRRAAAALPPRCQAKRTVVRTRSQAEGERKRERARSGTISVRSPRSISPACDP